MKVDRHRCTVTNKVLQKKYSNQTFDKRFILDYDLRATLLPKPFLSERATPITATFECREINERQTKCAQTLSRLLISFLGWKLVEILGNDAAIFVDGEAGVVFLEDQDLQSFVHGLT
jgi:hypothetical protein